MNHARAGVPSQPRVRPAPDGRAPPRARPSHDKRRATPATARPAKLIQASGNHRPGAAPSTTASGQAATIVAATANTARAYPALMSENASRPRAITDHAPEHRAEAGFQKRGRAAVHGLEPHQRQRQRQCDSAGDQRILQDEDQRGEGEAL